MRQPKRGRCAAQSLAITAHTALSSKTAVDRWTQAAIRILDPDKKDTYVYRFTELIDGQRIERGLALVTNWTGTVATTAKLDITEDAGNAHSSGP